MHAALTVVAIAMLRLFDCSSQTNPVSDAQAALSKVFKRAPAR